MKLMLYNDNTRRTNAKVIISYRTDTVFIPEYGRGAHNYASGLGYYSWNEMVDVHIVANPLGVGDSGFYISEQQSQAILNKVRTVNWAYISGTAQYIVYE